MARRYRRAFGSAIGAFLALAISASPLAAQGVTTAAVTGVPAPDLKGREVIFVVTPVADASLAVSPAP